MKPYNQTESKKEQVRTMFDGIARRYDLLNHLLSLGIDRGWRRRVVRMVRLHRPAEILDMATGTGDLAIMLAEACPAAQITGIDLSERMLAIGREKVERKGLSGRIRLSQGDAETPRYGEGRFDAATVAFGVRNFEDLPGGMTGLYRALKPGGVLAAVLYSGKVIGNAEKKAAAEFFRSLPLADYTVLICEFANWADTAPLPCFVIKREK